ncbi:MAG: hypothetical protein U0V48_14130 [Anaerolineales bacterium]
MINVNDVTAAYGALTALKGVSLNVQKGEIFGLLGPNGARRIQQGDGREIVHH